MNKKNQPILLGNRNIGAGFPPFIIAEMSGNHNQSLDRALQIVEAAANSGVDALKIQTYTADTMTLDIKDEEFLITDPSSLWYGKSLYELYKEASTPWEWHMPIIERARELGITVFSTPFDETAVDFLEELDVPCYKIASFENTDIPLVRKVAATGKPMIISTGMATVAELDETVREARKAGCRDLILLKCTSSYPAHPSESNILTIPHMRDLLECEVGLSDHTKGIGVSIASVVLGASVIEKHFTLCRADGGLDSDFSLEPAEMKSLVFESKRAWQALGQVKYGAVGNEGNSQQYRRSIYIIKNVCAGEKFTRENIRCIRPGLGLPPKYFNEVLGKKALCDAKRGTALDWSMIRY